MITWGWIVNEAETSIASGVRGENKIIFDSTESAQRQAWRGQPTMCYIEILGGVRKGWRNRGEVCLPQALWPYGSWRGKEKPPHFSHEGTKGRKYISQLPGLSLLRFFVEKKSPLDLQNACKILATLRYGSPGAGGGLHHYCVITKTNSQSRKNFFENLSRYQGSWLLDLRINEKAYVLDPRIDPHPTSETNSPLIS